MSIVTLKEIKRAQEQVDAMIAKFEAQAQRFIGLPAVQVELHHGERYAGLVLAADGMPSHHLILLPGDADEVNWEAAKQFAAKTGGELPTRAEQAILYGNLKSEFEQRYYWSCEQHAANADYAWYQYFLNGTQDSNFKSASLRARAVRRLPI